MKKRSLGEIKIGKTGTPSFFTNPRKSHQPQGLPHAFTY
jgi:hypothetical protein